MKDEELMILTKSTKQVISSELKYFFIFEYQRYFWNTDQFSAIKYCFKNIITWLKISGNKIYLDIKISRIKIKYKNIKYHYQISLKFYSKMLKWDTWTCQNTFSNFLLEKIDLISHAFFKQNAQMMYGSGE